MKIAVAGGTGVVGHHVVEVAHARGHETVILARSAGIDLLRGEGLAAALTGVDIVIDVTSTATAAGAESVRFFSSVTDNLLQAEQSAGTHHHIALSIIGATKVNAGYYAGKKAQEDLVTASVVPWTILRAAQFHEFATQIIPQGKVGPLQIVPTMIAQPIAAAEVAAVLVEIAEGDPRGLATDLAGPKTERMSDLVRRYLRATGSRRPVLQVTLPGAWWRGLRDGAILPGPDARLGTQTFDEWLAALVAAE
jgi:uncharacterized protein YbjT (DUF2867 family)